MICDFDQTSCLAENTCKENPCFLKIVLSYLKKTRLISIVSKPIKVVVVVVVFVDKS